MDVQMDPINIISDEQLAKRYREGDERAFALIFERCKPKVEALALAITRNLDMAETCLTEVFVKLEEHIRKGKLRELSSLQCWVMKTARNTAISLCRKKRPPIVPIDDSVANPELVEPYVTFSNPLEIVLRDEEEYIEREMELRLNKAISELPDRDRMIIKRKFYKGESLEEIASHVGLKTASAVYKRLKTIYSQLADKLGG